MAKHGDGMVKRGNLFGKLRLDFLFVYESRRDDIIIEIPIKNIPLCQAQWASLLRPPASGYKRLFIFLNEFVNSSLCSSVPSVAMLQTSCLFL